MMRCLYTLKTEEYDRLINVLMDLAAYIYMGAANFS